MLKVENLSIRYGTKALFENVNLEFKPDCCYGVIGANGAGKSTFLKVISGNIESTKGNILIDKGERISVLSQNHNEFNDYEVLETVIMGNTELYRIMKAKEALYSKLDFNDEDGIQVALLEEKFSEMNGWQAESDAAILLSALGIKNEMHYKKMNELKDKEKVKVLLAKALFGDPDILLLDEPTNGLDMKSKMWLEEFLINFKNTVLVVSHDRYFLNKVCTHILDIDYGKIKLFIGNYDFWLKSSELVKQQMKDSNKKKEEKIKELQDFIARFSANASKSKQATSRKKTLEKIVLEDIIPSNRKYPYINFEFDKVLSKEGIILENISYSLNGVDVLKNINMTIRPDDKIALIGENELAKTCLLNIISGKLIPDTGTVKYAGNTKISYFQKNHDELFNEDITLIDFLRKYSQNQDESYIRGFLGRMLFSGEDGLKKITVLSGGEKVRLVFSKMMLEYGNILLLDEPTNHLDMESITSLNTALEKYMGPIIFSSFDQELIESVSNRLVEINQEGKIRDKQITYQEYIEKYGIN
ncbi:MAG: ATP-binding cassette domain-containing protein [Clostridium sp.]|nr:ATP-binding cassette domain-containing protein [Clostridium sp.]MCM1444769.1 ATP-binding cassette domain-containing protein [Candidatus Amulumruptor caecigallinarius]